MVKLPKKVTTVLKIVISAVLVYFIFTKLNFSEVVETIKKTNPFYMVCALILFLISKILASFRLNTFFHQLKLFLTHPSNMKLYLLGMFYNLFLPGGIGGDAYKGFIIKKNFEVETKKIVSVLLLDRLSGMLLLFIYACTLTLLLNNRYINDYKLFIALLIPLSLLVYYMLNKKFFTYVLPVFWLSLGYSALVQIAQLAIAFFILRALGVEENFIAYLVIFLLSSITSILSIGGLGSREITFYYGALWLNLDDTIAVSVSITFFFITAVVSVFGMYFHFKNPTLKTWPQ